MKFVIPRKQIESIPPVWSTLILAISIEVWEPTMVLKTLTYCLIALSWFYYINKIRKGEVRVDLFDMVTSELTGEAYLNEKANKAQAKESEKFTQAVELLRDLHDFQNGIPDGIYKPKHIKEYKDTIENIRAFLTEHE